MEINTLVVQSLVAQNSFNNKIKPKNIHRVDIYPFKALDDDAGCLEQTLHVCLPVISVRVNSKKGIKLSKYQERHILKITVITLCY